MLLTYLLLFLSLSHEVTARSELLAAAVQRGQSAVLDERGVGLGERDSIFSLPPPLRGRKAANVAAGPSSCAVSPTNTTQGGLTNGDWVEVHWSCSDNGTSKEDFVSMVSKTGAT